MVPGCIGGPGELQSATLHHMANEDFDRYVACQDCDALFTALKVGEGERVLCPRCGANLFTRHYNTVQRTSALVLAAAVLYVAANLFPFLTLSADYRESDMLLIQSVTGLEGTGYPPLASAVAIFVFVSPVVIICGLLYLLLPLLAGKRLSGSTALCRLVYEARHWNMVEVYLLGVLVSLLKLGSLAQLKLGISFYAYVGFIVCLTAAVATTDYRELWDHLENAKRKA